MIKIILLLFAAAVIGLADTSKEPILYIGHAQIKNNSDEWCVIRLICAENQKQADSLFRPLCDSLEKCYHGKSEQKLYLVYKLQPSMVLKIKTDESPTAK